MNVPEPTDLRFHELLAEAKRKHDEAKAAHARGEVPDEVYLQRLDDLEEVQRRHPAHAGRLRAVNA